MEVEKRYHSLMSTEAQRISEVTRRKVFDSLRLSNFPWAGQLSEPDFLMRIYDLDSLPSTDHRYSTADGDIRQHQINNYDWDDDWVFSDPRFGLQHGADETLLSFLAEMLHPVVRTNGEQNAFLLGTFNDALARDGYELYPAESMSGHAIYGWRARGGFHGTTPDLRLSERELLTDPAVLEEHLTRIRDSLIADPAAAISSCKNLLESLFRIILDRSNVDYARSDDISQLYRKLAKLLRLNAESVPKSIPASKTSQQILRTLVTTVQSLSELRNELGIGHGKSRQSIALTRHARLALNSTVTIAEF